MSRYFKALLILPLFSFLPIYGENMQIPPKYSTMLDLKHIFFSSPVIYSILMVLSLITLTVWIYTLFTLRLNDVMPLSFITQLKGELAEKRYESALRTCRQESCLSSTIIASGISMRKYGSKCMMDAMKTEGKRCGAALWQRISILNDIAVASPMLGLLGTVVGMFYAFYDMNRTVESISAVFDGLGIAIGTTVGGLVVAIMAMMFYTTLKYRLIRMLHTLENEAFTLNNLIETEE